MGLAESRRIKNRSITYEKENTDNGNHLRRTAFADNCGCGGRQEAYFWQQGEPGVCVNDGSRSFGWKACRRSFG